MSTKINQTIDIFKKLKTAYANIRQVEVNDLNNQVSNLKIKLQN